MARLPSSFRSANRTTKNFRRQYSDLPSEIQLICRDYCVKFDEDPDHPSLRRKPLTDKSSTPHKDGSVSVSITMRYRAIYVTDSSGINVWYWIGSHASYNTFVGSSKK